MTLSRFLPILLTAMLAFSTAQAAERAVTVTGEATVSVPPDTAVIRIGVSSLEKTAREAGEANAKQMTAVLAAIKASGIAERDIQTSRLSLQPQYDPNKGGTRLTGFQANNQVTIRIRDIDSLPAVLDRAIAAGANEMSGIEFVVSEQSKLLDQARDEAIADARRKAELYAKAAGAKLGQVISISEEGTAPQPRAMQAVRAGAVPIAPGEQIDGQRDIAGVGEAPRDVFDVLVEAVDLVDDDDGGEWPRAVRSRQVAIELGAARREGDRLGCNRHGQLLFSIIRGNRSIMCAKAC